MNGIIGFLGDFLWETLYIVFESGIYILLGFLIAGLLHAYLKTDRLIPFLGGRNLRSVLNAALVGAPLPLCSCGVVPTAVALRKKGASREATLSFLISTPETSVDSIALSYGLLGPVMAVVRPLAAVVTAVVAGAAHLLFGHDETRDLEAAGEPNGSTKTSGTGAATGEGACGPECSAFPADSGKAVDHGPDHDHDHDHAHDHAGHTHADPFAASPPLSHRERLGEAGRYGFVHLFDELAFWFLFGMLLTGLLSAALPDDFFGRALGTGLFSMLVVVVVGVPLYMCASSSTPVALAFLTKGLNPGAALVFLLTGPATNAATLSVVGRVFGKRFLQIYVGSIVGVAIAFGMALNSFYQWEPVASLGAGETTLDFVYRVLKGIGFLVFVFLAVQSLRRTGLRPGLRELRENLATAVRPLIELRPAWFVRTIPGRLVLGGAILFYLASGFAIVKPGEAGMPLRFGAPALPASGETVLGPGLHWNLPWPMGEVRTVSVEGFARIDIGFRSAEDAANDLTNFYAPAAPGVAVGSDESAPRDRLKEESLYLTADENLVNILSTAQYRTNDPVQYLFGVEDGPASARAAILASLLEELATRTLDEVLTVDRFALESAVQTRANERLTQLSSGIVVEHFTLLNVHSPPEVHFDFRDVASSQEDRARFINEARVYAEDVVHQARGRAAEITAGAAADRTVRIASASGDAHRFLAIQDAQSGAPGSTRLRLYLETMERTLPKTTNIVRPDPSAVRDFEIWFQSKNGEVTIPSLDSKNGGK